MRRDRIADNIHVFVSETYLQVTATVVFTSEGSVVIDATPFPAEARQILAFIEREGAGPVRYVVYTHHHADHVYGACVFQGAEVIAQDQCRRILAVEGAAALARARADTPALAGVRLHLPDLTVEASGPYSTRTRLALGDQALDILPAPGHSVDGLAVLIEGEKALAAGDAVMPVPYFAGGDRQRLAETLVAIKGMEPDFVIQGHGPVLLRGEVEETIDASLAYMQAVEDRVRDVIARKLAPSALRDVTIESCGLSRIPLDGMVSKLHLDNLVAVYRELVAL